MRKLAWLFTIPLAFACTSTTVAQAKPPADPDTSADKPGDGGDKDKAKPDKDAPEELKAESHDSKGSVTVGGRRIDYSAVAGTLIVHPPGWEEQQEQAAEAAAQMGEHGPKPPTPATAAMSYVAYFQTGADEHRPILFLYNGGPGSATVWLHMGAFGPRRVVTNDDSHTEAAPYKVVDNAFSLLDAADLVFIDAPGTGFGKVIGKDKDKAFYGVDADGAAFTDFITQFLSKYGRWNSPKYIFGESYGTTRSAVLAWRLETEKSIDLNGVILLSQILNFDGSVDGADGNPGVDLPYELALPTYAATAWYHKKLSDTPAQLEQLVAEVEKFAMGDYAAALAAGATLDPAQRKAVLEKLHRYTGLSVAYLDKADLRVTGGEFEKALQDDAGLTTGRLDSRFSGPTMDPLSKEADYDPQAASIAPAYVSAYNDYARKALKMPADKVYKPFNDEFAVWKWEHQGPTGPSWRQTTNVMPDLAAAMKYNPNLKVQLDTGYYDIATPFYQAVYELQHLAMPAKLQSNIEMKFYPSGHMVYANEASLKALHDNVAAFIAHTHTTK
jgi:carboxypeptidase C (cathepsin A)